MTDLRNAHIYDSDGNHVEAFRSAIAIYDADVHRQPVNTFFHTDDGVLSTTLSAPTIIDDNVITLASVTGLTTGMMLHLDDLNLHPEVMGISGNDVTLNVPMGVILPVGTSVHTVSIDMAGESGTLSVPISYKIQPPTGVVWHIMRIMPTMTSADPMDDGLFGGATALTNGIVFRKYDGTLGVYGALSAWKTNGDLRSDMYDVSYNARSGGGGAYGLNGRGTIKLSGAILRLDGTAGDFAELLLQDTIPNTSVRMKAQGHIEGA